MGAVFVRLILLASFALAASAGPAYASATIQYIQPSTTTAAEIVVSGDGANDVIKITQSGQSYTFSGAGLSTTGCTLSGLDVVCPNVPAIRIDLGGGNDTLTTDGVTTPLAIAGGDGDDTLNGGAGNDVLAGGENNDTLDGGAGVDDYFGEGGNDTIQALDGNAERIACGAGNDAARNDFTDIIAECERGIDGDFDGFSSAVDCNDANAAIHPGVVDIPEDGIDQDCSGADLRILDRDGDGFSVPVDCNDADRAIHPGALEIRGDDVDENCDSVAQGFALLRSLVSTNWEFARTFTRVRALVVRNAPAGARIAVVCSGRGCPFRGTKRVTVPRDLAPVSLLRFFRSAKLRAGSRVTVGVTAAATVGRTYAYRIRLGDLPALSITCRPPGAKESRAC